MISEIAFEESLLSEIAKKPIKRLPFILKKVEYWASLRIFCKKYTLSNLVADNLSSFNRGNVKC